jgi:predicted ferric reductase
MRTARALVIWVGLSFALVLPVVLAATSEYLAWRDPIYIIAGVGGVVALCLLLVQPLLARGWLPGINLPLARRFHRAVGVLLVAAVVVHVVGLWITSPPDIIDALLLRSPTSFAVWGVFAMWALFAAALLSLLQRRLSQRFWRVGHTSLVSIVVLGGAVHAMLIDGTMNMTSKAVLCGLVMTVTMAAIASPWLRRRCRFLSKKRSEFTDQR